MNIEEIFNKYIVLRAIRIEKIPKCSDLVSRVRNNLAALSKLEAEKINDEYNDLGDDKSLGRHLKENESDSSDRTGMKNNLELIFQTLGEEPTEQFKHSLLIQIRDYADVQDIWKLPIWWSILKSLIYSSDDKYLDYGISALLDMIKRVGDEDKMYVKTKSNELFGYRVISFIKKREHRLTEKALTILKIMLEYDDLFLISLGNLIELIQRIEDQSEYLHLIQMFMTIVEKGDKNQKRVLCEEMTNIMSDTVLAKEKRDRAMYIFDAFHKQTI
jgi:hypothetical protein